ncbi:hypothetical protein BIY24_11980 [Halobacteriovorax marinus]|uniref:hypothetical protein n=1 Tax=Halobacteriovorax marinus TaxID=97084 RepID=UPI000BC2E795|nr:hypothetical protein [Halobacteriovorax marinus]ATH08638.1 hypothetical protein BIY24_11980 [Halobacteriovorax marinus]
MKSFFRLMLFSTLSISQVQAMKDTPLVLITYEGSDIESFNQIQKIMNERFQVSKELYQVELGPCKKKHSLATHVCIDKDLNVTTLSRNNEVMEDMLGIYWK